ncbi:hypothetical protein PSN45_002278 [Yamadazyma tenuis]|uniref:Pre-mRNA-splicing factor 18 n=1 Tax=Candida tenuis (strain ATCC 10573 / BCRC 21748 / CBS 615 / JCM 9827 / NBRC 10315 / NRRL Y-1498 / VKM Y-70) TaxID=590646 RepID=G3BF21_CANTC|nr:Prp18-domain-containing protein [Yamadazyma tenuis ATCC 10573]EGV59989.1 Prp18-domain-containing protein [Yamadazyma tenuis ATCC 10573]WEJ94782.1 hypothetical protein PSN45_002278 [Yamadazyma tenuis]
MNFSKVLSKEIKKKRKGKGVERGDKRRRSEKGDGQNYNSKKVVDGAGVIECERGVVGSDTNGNVNTNSDETAAAGGERTDISATAAGGQDNKDDAAASKNADATTGLQVQQQLRINAKRERYRQQAAKEAAIDPQFCLDQISAIHKHKLVVQLRVYIKSLVHQWEKATEALPPDSPQHELLLDTKKNLVPLLYKLRSDGLTDDMVVSLSTICYYLQHRQFRPANESYMKLSIGNVAWPIGVLHVGIHARSASSRITGEKSAANIMIDDKTRRWITAVKRLITFSETYDVVQDTGIGGAD